MFRLTTSAGNGGAEFGEAARVVRLPSEGSIANPRIVLPASDGANRSVQSFPEKLNSESGGARMDRVAVHSLSIDAQKRQALSAGFGAGVQEHIVPHVAGKDSEICPGNVRGKVFCAECDRGNGISLPGDNPHRNGDC